MSTTDHIPAWKRIGLKLKNSNDAVDQLTPKPSPPAATEIDLHPRNESGHKKRHRNDHENGTSHKRSRSEHSATVEPPVQSGNDRFISSIYKGRTLTGITKTPKKIVFDQESEPQASTLETPKQSFKPLSRKKSVTFTPETKAEDGESGQNFSKAWLSPNTATSAASPTIPDHAPDTPTKASVRAQNGSHESDQAKVKLKKSKRPKAKEDKQASSADSELRSACIQYLQQFHTDKDKWKFNKSRQNELLRHIWDVSVLPASLDTAIVEYVIGLQGAASRKRLYEGAVAILDQLVDRHKDKLPSIAMDTPDARKAAYEQALQQQIELMNRSGTTEHDDEVLATIRLETEQASRANEILWRALSQELYGDSSRPIPDFASSTPAATDTISTAAAKRKTRKSRTAASESSDSSSSDSDSDSSSDSDSDSTSDSESDSDSSSSGSSDASDD